LLSAGNEVVISLVKTNSGTPVGSGSMRFVGNAIAFHALSGDKFTVIYTSDAVAKPSSQYKKCFFPFFSFIFRSIMRMIISTIKNKIVAIFTVTKQNGW
jgi:hypothetical protein